MKLIDLHCDTIGKFLKSETGENLGQNKCSVSIPSMRKGNTMVQLFACFTYLPEFPEEGYEGSYRYVHKMIDCMEEQVKLFGNDIQIARSYEDIVENEAAGRISSILTVEEGGVLNGQMERLDILHERGIRLMTPIWNFENCLGHPNSRDAEVMKKGLKPFGREVVERMGELNMIVDVSHASDGTFWDILETAKSPIIASHSNCRALCDHPRNMTDEMIRALAERGGVSGLNFYGMFLGGKKESLIDDMVAHVLHMIQVGGSEFPAIGTDFDGFSGMEILEIPEVADMGKLWDALKKKGISESQLDKIWCENALRILKNL